MSVTAINKLVDETVNIETQCLKIILKNAFVSHF